jgi:hypothetical protein
MPRPGRPTTAPRTFPASPRRRLALVALAGAASLPLLPALGGAQGRPEDRPVPPWERRSPVTLSLGAGGLYSGARTGGGARLNDGAGFDVHGAIGVSALSLGVGYQRTTQGLPGTEADATIDGIFVEPRLAIAPVGSFTPYLAGRVGFLRRDVPASARWEAGRSNFTQLGAGAGLLVSVAPSVHLDLGALYTWVRDREARDVAAPGPFVGGTGGRRCSGRGWCSASIGGGGEGTSRLRSCWAGAGARRRTALAIWRGAVLRGAVVRLLRGWWGVDGGAYGGTA